MAVAHMPQAQPFRFDEAYDRAYEIAGEFFPDADEWDLHNAESRKKSDFGMNVCEVLCGDIPKPEAAVDQLEDLAVLYGLHQLTALVAAGMYRRG